MWRPKELGTLLAEKTILARSPREKVTNVILRIGLPTQPVDVEKGAPWWCPVQIVGMGSRRVVAVAGEDSLQALVLALSYVRRRVLEDARKRELQLSWPGNEVGLLGEAMLVERHWDALERALECLWETRRHLLREMRCRTISPELRAEARELTTRIISLLRSISG